MNIRRSLLLLLMTICLFAGIAEADGPFVDNWRSELKARNIPLEKAVYPFAVTDVMVDWARDQMSGYESSTPVHRLTVLQDALYGWKDERFQYDETLTLTAQEAFAQRRGNCMAFTSLFIGLARGLDIPMSLVSIEKVPGVGRSDRLVVVNRHVVAGYQEPGSLVLFDFNLTSEAPVARHEVVEDTVASAMYHANLGGSAIRSGDLETADHHLVLATRLAPEWGPGWINLGVVRYRQGEYDDALRAYKTAIEVEPDSSSAFANIAVVHQARGNDEAARAALEAATQLTATPFALIAMADIEIEEGNLGAARSNLRRARWWFDDIPEVFEAMARLAHAEGDVKRRQRYLEKAESLRGR